MKSKFLMLVPIATIALSACSLAGKAHPSSDYVLDLDISGKDDYKILQLTDIHLGDKDNQQLHFDFMDLIIDDANADFIVVTGDIFTFASRSTAIRFFKWLDGHNLPWTVTFGNHDEQCYFSIDWLTGYLNTLNKKRLVANPKDPSNCVFLDIQDDKLHGNANFAINLKKDGNIFEQLIVMDSNRYYYGTYFGYDWIKPEQIQWYSDLVDYTTEQNGGETVKSMLFYHIPLPEINKAWDLGTNHNFEGTEESGDERETTCPPDHNSGFFEVIKQKDSTKAMFFGHDHVNDFCKDYEGITFCYGVKSTDRIYYDDKLLGGQVITIHNDNSFSVKQIHHTYEEVK